jgi:urease accessory protein UreF
MQLITTEHLHQAEFLVSQERHLHLMLVFGVVDRVVRVHTAQAVLTHTLAQVAVQVISLV